jgi:hypothetical protein
MDKFSLSFNFIPYKEVLVVKDVLKFVGFDQKNENLKKIGVESGSAIF